MQINLDVVVDTPEQSLDMKAGLETFQGISDATRLIAETILKEAVPQRLSYKGRVRTNLKNSFKGSYGQVFELNFSDGDLVRRFNQIGRPAFLELMKYFLSHSMYEDHEDDALSAKSIAALDRLGDVSDGLIKQLRISALDRIHQVSLKFGYDTRLRFRKSGKDQLQIAKFDINTAQVLESTEDPRNLDLTVSITRLNINTGNGRLVEEGGSETVAFGFNAEYKLVRLAAKKLFSENLDYNNGLSQDKWRTLKISARAIKLRDGKIVKYIITGIRQ